MKKVTKRDGIFSSEQILAETPAEQFALLRAIEANNRVEPILEAAEEFANTRLREIESLSRKAQKYYGDSIERLAADCRAVLKLAVWVRQAIAANDPEAAALAMRSLTMAEMKADIRPIERTHKKGVEITQRRQKRGRDSAKKRIQARKKFIHQQYAIETEAGTPQDKLCGEIAKAGNLAGDENLNADQVRRILEDHPPA